MKAVLQRVLKAAVVIEGQKVAEINQGLLVLFCAEVGDSEETAQYFAEKIVKMRIFSDSQDKMNLSIKDINGKILAVSQFTLCADWKKGNRPSFSKAENPENGKHLYQKFCDFLRDQGIEVQTGVFGAKMAVELVNDGPVTIVL